MTIAAGTRLGRYEVRSKIGEGGMGEVYLAQDTKLDRKVALKILPIEVATNQDRMRRFVQEAKAASALNHPNIITIYEIDETTSGHFIATELIDGETLRARLRSTPLALGDVIDIATQIASALAAAHQAGIVHRDIKPENVMLRPDGFVKVLDFGLAKLTEDKAPTDPEAATVPMVKTESGMVMGTATYMSPEQARAQEIDARTDIWSLGVVLYEMAAGKPPFEGESTSDVIAAILKTEPPRLTSVALEVPPELQRIVRKALRKDRDERYQTIKDMALDLKNLGRELDIASEVELSSQPLARSGELRQSRPATSKADGKLPSRTEIVPPASPTSSAEYIASQIKGHKRGVALAFAVLVLIAGVATFVGYRYLTSKQAAGHFSSGRKLNIKRLTSSGKVGNTAISPDGRYVAYVAEVGDKESIRLLQVNTGSDVEIVAPVEPELKWPSFSRDGDYLYYNHVGPENAGTLYQVPALGGKPRQIRYDISSGAAVSPDGKTIAFVHQDHQTHELEMMLANADGLNVRRIAADKAHEPFFWADTPAWSSDGKMIACGVASRSVANQHLKLVGLRISDGAEQPLSDREWSYIDGVSWLADGNLIVSGMLETNAPDEHSQLWLIKPGVAPEALTTDLIDYSGVSMTAEGGALVTMRSQLSEALWIAPNNDAARAVRVMQETADPWFPSWTLDGRLIYTSGAAGGNWNIWLVNADGTNKKQLTNQCSCFTQPMSSDGRYIIYARYDADWKGHVWRMDADGSNEKQLTSGIGEDGPTFSRDGKWVIYSQRGTDDKSTLWKVPLDGGAPTQLTATQQAFDPTVSPLDGSIAYMFNDKEDNYARKISVIPPDGGAPLRTFAFPKEGVYGLSRFSFTPDGRSLAFVGKHDNGANLWTIPADGKGEPKPITDFKTETIRFFAWSSDGKQLALIRGTSATDVVLLSEAK